jgi:hypothetical protein
MILDGYLMVENYFFEEGKTDPTWVFIYRLHKGIPANPDRAKLKIQPKFEETLPPSVLSPSRRQGLFFGFENTHLYQK